MKINVRALVNPPGQHAATLAHHGGDDVRGIGAVTEPFALARDEMRREREAADEQQNQGEWRGAHDFLIHRFAPEHEARRAEKECGVARTVERRQRPRRPRDGLPVVNNQVTDIEEFEVRDREIDRRENEAERVGELRGDFVQVASEQQNSRDENQADGGVHRRRGEDQ